MTGSWALASAPSFRQLNSDVWRLNTPLGAPTPSKPFSAVADGVLSVGEKGSSNFPVSFVDVYGRGQAPHLINDTNPRPGVATLWSSIRQTDAYKAGTLPYPIIVATVRKQGSVDIPLNASILEMGPIETGQRHPSLSAYVPTEYIGTDFANGAPATSQCVQGFDSASFFMGSSSDILGEGIETAGSTLAANPAVIAALAPVPDQVVDTGRVPAPFRGLAPGAYAESAQTEIVRLSLCALLTPGRTWQTAALLTKICPSYLSSCLSDKLIRSSRACRFSGAA